LGGWSRDDDIRLRPSSKATGNQQASRGCPWYGGRVDRTNGA
jgi:hypothetical protein